MGRRRRNLTEPHCYHITHRCHVRDFLLKFKKDRKNYLLRMYDMGKFGDVRAHLTCIKFGDVRAHLT
jgi:hypothetical protein